jgi:hypothetical protein
MILSADVKKPSNVAAHRKIFANTCRMRQAVSREIVARPTL